MALPNVAQGQPHVAAHNAERALLNQLETEVNLLKNKETVAKAPYIPRRTLDGPASTEAITFNPGVDYNGAVYTDTYMVSGSTMPEYWPVDAFGKMSAAGNVWSAKTSVEGVGSAATYRFLVPGDRFMIFAYATDFIGRMWVDGKPFANNPMAFVASSGFAPYGFQEVIFTDGKKTRLIEIQCAGLVAVYAQLPHRLLRPTRDLNPGIAVQGDSYVLPSVLKDAGAGVELIDPWMKGIYQVIGPMIGDLRITADGIGGSGYIAGGTTGEPYGHANRMAWLAAVNPEAIIVHGGGANDIWNGQTNDAIIAAARTHFNELKEQHPDTKLIFNEGFSPPLFTPATFNPKYTAIRQGVQTALAGDKVDAYFVDVATSRPPLFGSGTTTGPNGTGNSDEFVGDDGAHLTVKGHVAMARFLAPKYERILADEGRLVGQLI